MGTIHGENSIIQSISTAQAGQSIDFVEVFNPANFKAQRASLVAGARYDVQVNPHARVDTPAGS